MHMVKKEDAMKFTVNRTELLAAAQNAERIAPKVSTIEILQCAYLQAEQDTLTVASGNLEIALERGDSKMSW